jgi:hypothetical protein
LRLLLPGHCEEGPHDARAALGAVRILSAADLRGGVSLLLEQHRARDDDRKRIVELVRDARKKRAQRRQLFALVQ